mgnify:CR=1 FL=1|jgi:Predicted exporter
MEPARQKFIARLILFVFALVGAFWLLRLDYGRKISTNVIDLIPVDERAPELSLVRSLTDQQQARVLLLALSSGSEAPPAEAVSAFADSLRRSPTIAEVEVLGASETRNALGTFVFERRFDFLLPRWLAEKHAQFSSTGRPASEFSTWLAGDTAEQLDHFLTRAESVAFQELLPSDPLLLVPSLVEKIQSLAVSSSGEVNNHALVWAIVRDSPFSEAGQDPVFGAIESALSEARAIASEVELRWTGVNRFAAESKARIKAEISWLNTASLIGVIGIACLFVRRLWKVLHLVPVVLFSTLGAWVVTTMVFERVHILVFVIGSLLAGVAIDYGFYLYMQPALRPDEPYREKLGRLLKPLLTSCLTTVIGFSLLFWSELPLVQQLGVFVSAGLISAVAVAMLYFAQLDRAFLETRNFSPPSSPRARYIVRPLFALALIVAVVGPWCLHWRDDIRQLEIPAVELRANDAAVRQLFGDAQERTAYLTHGETPALARAALERFTTWHDAQFPHAPATSAGYLLPTEAAWTQRGTLLNALADFPEKLRPALDTRGYTAESFEPFFSAWEDLRAAESPAYASLFTDIRRVLTGPLGLLFHLDENGGPSWFLTLADHPPGAEPPAETSTFGVAQLESLNSLFSRYRADTAKLSIIGLSIIGLSVFVLYGLRRGVRIFMIPAGSCFFALGLLGLLGQPLNLFHLLAAFLGVCLSHNYAIFSAENARRHEPPPPSIRISALTTGISFGVLAFSRIPVISALGSTVALIVFTALLMVELEPLGQTSGHKKPPAN